MVSDFGINLGFVDHSEMGPQGFGYQLSEANFKDVKNLINADTKRKLKLASLSFGEPTDDIQTLISLGPDLVKYDLTVDYGSIRKVLLLAMELRVLLNKGFFTQADLESLGFTIIPVDTETIKKSRENALRVLAVANKHTGKPLPSIANRHAKLSDCAFTGSLEVLVNGSFYIDFLKRASAIYDFGKVENVADVYTSLEIFSSGYYDLTDNGLYEFASDILDRIFTFHLVDIHTVCVNQNEVRSSDSKISTIWWLTLDQMRDGRLGVCKVCKRPFITKGERGQKRFYCSDACRQKTKPSRKRTDSAE